jgi:C-terminal peptidase prc
MRIRIGLGILVSALSLPLSVFAFSDVPQEAYFSQAVENLAQSGAIDRNLNFNPNEPITKVAFLKILFAAGEFEFPENQAYETPFPDVSATEWYAPYLQTAFNLHAIGFDPRNPNFNPASTITREEALRMAISVTGLSQSRKVSAEEMPCAGVQYNQPSAHLFVAAGKYQLINQLEKSFCQALIPMTRAEAAFMIHQAWNQNQNAISPIKPIQSQDVDTQTQTEFSFEKNKANGDNKITLSFGGDEAYAKQVEELFENQQFQVLLDVWSRINTEFVFKQQVEKPKAIYGAISGMVKNLGDEYSEFQDPKSANSFNEDLNGSFYGIGATVDMRDSQIIIVSPLRGSPAEKAGIQPNDIILKINDESTSNLTLNEAVAKIRGPQGSKVKLLIEREGKQLTLEVERDEIKLDYVETELKGSNVAYLRISAFAEDTHAKFLEEMKTLEKSPVTGLIIDLRNNPGGYLDSAVDILGHFVAKGEKVAQLKLADNKFENYLSKGEAEFAKFKIVVLVNEGSASASEIVAGTLQDYKLATLIGTKTFGKGSVQQIIGYEDGSQLKLSIANWYTANGRGIDKKGLTPDVVVESGDIKDSKADTQLQKAIEFLK